MGNVDNGLTPRKWFALYTKPRHEFSAAKEIGSAGVEYYLPTIIKTKQWSDRKKKINEPLFRGYIFIYGTEKERLIAVTQKSIVKTIMFLGKPAVIPDWELENLKNLLVDSPEVFINDTIATGNTVKIIEGPFKDVTGIVTDKGGDNYLSVSVELLNRSVSVRLSKESIVKMIEN